MKADELIRPTEAEFEKAVVELAHLLGWRVAAFRPARRKRGGGETWETPCKYDAKGWPDLTLVRDRVVFAELKSARGKLSGEQAVWIATLTEAGAEVFCWTPDDWPMIEEILASGSAGGTDDR